MGQAILLSPVHVSRLWGRELTTRPEPCPCWSPGAQCSTLAVGDNAMAEPTKQDQTNKPDQANKPNVDIVRDLKVNEQHLSLHLDNGESLQGKIRLFDKFNLIFESEGGKRYWVPKHAVAYAELL